MWITRIYGIEVKEIDILRNSKETSHEVHLCKWIPRFSCWLNDWPIACRLLPKHGTKNVYGNQDNHHSLLIPNNFLFSTRKCDVYVKNFSWTSSTVRILIHICHIFALQITNKLTKTYKKRAIMNIYKIMTDSVW